MDRLISGTCLLLLLLAAVPAPAQDVPAAADFIYKASIKSSGSLGDVVYTTAEGDFPTLHVGKNEKLDIAFTVPAALLGQAVRIRADDGGVIKGGQDGLFSAAAQGRDAVLKFTYILGGFDGRYSLKISAPGFLHILEFWVGKERPRAEPGPALHFSAPQPEIPKIPAS